MTQNATASYDAGYRDCRGCREHSVNLALAKCDHNESCTGKLAPISSKGPKFVAQTDFCVHRLRIWDNTEFSQNFQVFY